MDAFFTSVEQRDNPSLRGKPVLVGGDGPRSVVAAASYEARVFGCRSAQPMSVARRLCPHAVVVKGGYDRYKEASAAVFSVFDRFTPLVQPLSIDEAFLDVTGSVALLGPPEVMARQIREQVAQETRLTCSVGVAPNKFLAKLASEMDKPDGLTVIGAHEVLDRIGVLPVAALWGVGPSAQRSLDKLGVRTVEQLRAFSESALVGRFGASFGAHLWRLARGMDDRPVVTDREAKSVGHERTFDVDLDDPEQVRTVLMRETEQVGHRLRRKGRRARGVTVKIRYGDFETITRSITLDGPTDRTDDLWRAGRALFDAWAQQGFRPVRLIGITATGLDGSTADDAQPGLFDAVAGSDRRTSARSSSLDRVADAIVNKYGTGAIGRGRGKE